MRLRSSPRIETRGETRYETCMTPDGTGSMYDVKKAGSIIAGPLSRACLSSSLMCTRPGFSVSIITSSFILCEKNTSWHSVQERQDLQQTGLLMYRGRKRTTTGAE